MMNPHGQAQMGAANATGAGGAPNPMQPNPMQPNPMQPNPMQQMMQQMMAGQQGAGAGAGTAALPESVQKARFASQLVQLANMGFSDESMCLRALAQHNGRLDSAIDVLLTGNVD